jgi:thiol-disulfide isomerase/thioredoxin/tetratricopeptide (TPR) repeat protein
LSLSRGFFSAAAIVAVAFSVATGAASGEAPPTGNASALQAGDPVPAFSARSLESGRQLTPADFAGKVLVVNFWATWCPPCRAETPDMVRAYRRLRANDVAFLGIDTTEVPSVINTFLSAKDVSYPIALGGPATYNGFGIAYIPTTVVIDAHGIVRARWTGQIAEERLAQFVADARAGKNYVLDTPDQQRVEALLDPSGYHFDGDAAAVKAEIARARSSIATSDKIAAAHGVGKDATVDYARVQTLQGALLLPAAQAALRLASTSREHVAADRMIASADGNLNRFADAVAALHDAQAADPTDSTLWLDIAKAYYRLHDYDAEIAAATAYTKAVPDDSDGWDALALANQRKRNFAAAAPLYEHTLALLRAAVDAAKTPADKVDAIANVADESLDLADVYVALGDEAGAARTFAQANAYGNRLDPNGPYANLYRNVHERTQEGLVAVRIAHGTGKTALSIVPWTGPDLPGSIASTLKYRLIVAKTPNAKVDLTALGLLPGWVASFCADGLCSPNRVDVVLPDSGVKTFEFQLVPPGPSRAPGSVRVRSSDGVVTGVPAAVALGTK